MTDHLNTIPFCLTCVCGKVAYDSRRLAKRVGKQRFPNQHMTVYRCPIVETTWHVAHLSPARIRGQA